MPLISVNLGFLKVFPAAPRQGDIFIGDDAPTDPLIQPRYVYTYDYGIQTARTQIGGGASGGTLQWNSQPPDPSMQALIGRKPDPTTIPPTAPYTNWSKYDTVAGWDIIVSFELL